MTLLSSINWSQPWYASVREAAASITGELLSALNQRAMMLGIHNHRGLPLRFVPQALLPEGEAYEYFISRSGQVPTRYNLHDAFNALVWLNLPRTKQTLNALQSSHIEQLGIGQHRSRLRDAATLFDENAALLVIRQQPGSDTLVTALRQHQWQHLFIDQREWMQQHCDVLLFGHALMEKLVTPYKAITAHAWVVMADEQYFNASLSDRLSWLDTTVALQLQQLGDTLHPTHFTPLPVLGIPDWWPDQDAAFYADTQVFRPKRLPQHS